MLSCQDSAGKGAEVEVTPLFVRTFRALNIGRYVLGAMGKGGCVPVLSEITISTFPPLSVCFWELCCVRLGVRQTGGGEVMG